MDNDDGETTMLGYRSVDGSKTLTKIADGDVFTVPFTDLSMRPDGASGRGVRHRLQYSHPLHQLAVNTKEV